MNYEELRTYLINFQKFSNCKIFPRVPLIHDGFPGTFNLSFAEYDMLKEYGGYSEIDHDLIYSTIQSCIRPQDIIDNINEDKGLWKYLGIFEMSDIAGQIILNKKEDITKIHSFQLKQLIRLLESLGLKKEKTYPSYFSGGELKTITKGKYSFDFNIPEDSFTKNEFIQAGIPEKNLIPDKTRNTFLSIHLHRKTPWGYRNEILYNIGTEELPKMLDIATLEYFLWFPTYNGDEEIAKNINGLTTFPHTISVGGIGVERLYMAINNLQEITEIDYLNKFYKLFQEIYPKLQKKEIIKAGEALRALHRIYSDIETYNLGKYVRSGNNRGRLIKEFIKIIFQNIPDFNELNISKLLVQHAISQPWHKNMHLGTKKTVERLKTYYFSPEKIKERSLKQN